MIATLEDQRCVARWRGLKEHVLLALNRLDAEVIASGRCRFIEQRRALIPDRLRVIELRATFGLDIFQKLKAGDASVQDDAAGAPGQVRTGPRLDDRVGLVGPGGGRLGPADRTGELDDLPY